MDTLPFNLVLFAVDTTLLWGLALWGNRRLWVLGIFLQWAAIIFVGRVLFRTTWGQNLIEGLFGHFGLYLFVSGVILFFKRRKATAVISGCAGIVLLGFGADMMLIEPNFVVVEHYRITSPKVAKPIRVVFIADTQTDRIGNYERRVFRIMKDQNADLVILGGDYIQAFGKRAKDLNGLREQFRFTLKNMNFQPPLGAFAIRGNNDTAGEEFEELFRETGFQAVEKTHTFDLGPIVLTALSTGDASLYFEGPKEYLKTEEERRKFHIMAGHFPSFALEKTDADLLLAGHTHGGQVQFPFYGQFVTGVKPSLNFPRRWGSGWTDLPNGSHLLVTRGTGMERGWAPQIRFYCRPEISVIEIVPE